MSSANRGKLAEGKLKNALTLLASSRYDFCFERIEDARSSKGASSTPRAGDFAIYCAGKNMLIECKEVAHEFRLPKPSFKNDQRARMRIRQLAGTICTVAIYHPTKNVWRDLPLSYFEAGETGSWDMSSTPTYTLAQIVERWLVKLT